MLLDIVNVVGQPATCHLRRVAGVAVNIVRAAGDEQVGVIEEVVELGAELQLRRLVRWLAIYRETV